MRESQVMRYDKITAMKDIPYRDEEVEGLPKFRLIRGFYDGLIGPFSPVKVDATMERKLISWLEQIIDTANSEEMREDVEEIMSRAKVCEVRQCEDRSLMVKYSYQTANFLLAQFSEKGELITYTFAPNEMQPFEVEADLIDENGDFHATTRWEDVVDFCWMAKTDTGCYVGVCDNCACLGMWSLGDGEEGPFEISFSFGFKQVFEISKTFTRREDMVDCVKVYMRCGMSAAQSYAHGWKSEVAIMYDRNSHREISYNLTSALHADCFRARRMGMKAVLLTLMHFCNWNEKFPSASLSLAVRNGSEHRIVQQIRAASKNDRNQFYGYTADEDDWKIDLYLALRGDKPSMRQIASLLERAGKPNLSNYWLRKVRGLPLSFEPIPAKPRIRKKIVNPRQQFLNV